MKVKFEGDHAWLNAGNLIRYIEELRARKDLLIEEKGARLAEKLGTKWYNEGEKSTRYFLRILNRAQPDDFKLISNEHGEEISDPEEIEKEIVNFYRKNLISLIVVQIY